MLTRSFGISAYFTVVVVCEAGSWGRTFSSGLARNVINPAPDRVGIVPRLHELDAVRKPWEIRGGAEEEYDEYDDEDSEFDDEDLFDDLDDAEFADGEVDFSENSSIDRVLEHWKKTPPVTKGYLTLSIAATLYGYIFNNNKFPDILALDWTKAIKKIQIWRLLTSFLNFGPLGLGYAMTGHFVWTYMSTLERLNHSRPFDFLIMMVFGQLCMVAGYPLLKMSPRFLGHNLSTFFVYVWSRYHEGLEVNLFELFNTRAEMLPWFFLGQTFLLEGELPTLDFLGIVFGHIYHYFKTVGMLRAPDSVEEWYNSDNPTASRIRQEYKHIKADFEV